MAKQGEQERLKQDPFGGLDDEETRSLGIIARSLGLRREPNDRLVPFHQLIERSRTGNVFASSIRLIKSNLTHIAQGRHDAFIDAIGRIISRGYQSEERHAPRDSREAHEARQLADMSFLDMLAWHQENSLSRRIVSDSAVDYVCWNLHDRDVVERLYDFVLAHDSSRDAYERIGNIVARSHEEDVSDDIHEYFAEALEAGQADPDLDEFRSTLDDLERRGYIAASLKWLRQSKLSDAQESDMELAQEFARKADVEFDSIIALDTKTP